MSTHHGILLHIVFSTKYRKPVLADAWRDSLFAYIGGIVQDHKALLLKAGGIEDHIHLLLRARCFATVGLIGSTDLHPRLSPVIASHYQETGAVSSMRLRTIFASLTTTSSMVSWSVLTSMASLAFCKRPILRFWS